MTNISDYDTIGNVSECEISIKGSRFIGIAMHCADDSDIQNALDQISHRYPDATHYCYAAIFGGSSRKEKSSDNGEPSGTAGKPILSVLKGSGYSDIICIVVRYFGGTLLGTGGLVHAYTETSKNTLNGVVAAKMTACAVYRFTLGYDHYNLFEIKCKDLMVCKPECDYSDKVDVKAYVKISDSEVFERRMSDLTERHAMLRRDDDCYVQSDTKK